MHFTKTSLASAFLLASNTLAIELDLNDPVSIKDAAETVASSIVDRYRNASIPGLFGDPYYFWESGLAWDSLLNYWHQTGDDAHNEIIGQALRFQLGPDNNYSPANQTKNLGNDDQSSWALAAMTAAEYGFPSDVLDDVNTTWVEIAKNVFEEQAARWDDETCGGGLRWQIFAFNNGYDYKNTMANGNFYQLASRLALYTGNSTYSDWAHRVYAWTLKVGLISDTRAVFDGVSATKYCTEINHIQWTGTAGTFLAGQAYAFNAVSSPAQTYPQHNSKEHPNRPHSQTPSPMNQGYIPTFISINATFASAALGAPSNGTLTEIACAPRQNCNSDQLAFRAILARALFQTRSLTTDAQIFTSPKNSSSENNATSPSLPDPSAPRDPAASFHSRVDFVLRTSAAGAAAQCSGGDSGTVCGSLWGESEWDGTQGLGQDLSALNVFLALLDGEGGLENVNSTPGGAGSGIAGGDGEDGEGEGNGEDDGVAASEGAAAGRVTVVSSVGLGLVGVCSLMALL